MGEQGHEDETMMKSRRARRSGPPGLHFAIPPALVADRQVWFSFRRRRIFFDIDDGVIDKLADGDR